MTGLYWRDLNGLADFQEVCQAMTAMAEGFVQQALDYHYNDLVKKYGLPIGHESGEPQPLLVLVWVNWVVVNSMYLLISISSLPSLNQGKHKVKPNLSIDNHNFFNQLGKRLIKTLNENTAEGFVFRVDMRLLWPKRAFGQ